MMDGGLDEHHYEILRDLERRAAEGDPEAINDVKEIKHLIDQLARRVAWAAGKIPFTPDGDLSE